MILILNQESRGQTLRHPHENKEKDDQKTIVYVSLAIKIEPARCFLIRSSCEAWSNQEKKEKWGQSTVFSNIRNNCSLTPINLTPINCNKAPLSEKDIRELAPKIGGLIYCQDDVLQPESLSEYRRLLPNSEHHVLKDCAHFPWEENARDYYQVLFQLMKG